VILSSWAFSNIFPSLKVALFPTTSKSVPEFDAFFCNVMGPFCMTRRPLGLNANNLFDYLI